MSFYEYPQIIGHKWNLLQKISISLNIPISQIYVGDSFNDYIQKTYIGFYDVELTTSQKTQLDNIVMNESCSVPQNTGNTTYKVPELFKMRQWFISQIGIEPTFWFDEENIDGSGECYLYLQFPRPLTTTEKKLIVSVYTSALKEV